MLRAILGIFGGAGGIAAELRKAHADRLNAANNSERIAAEERMNLALSRVDAQTKGAGSMWAKVMRAAFAIPFVIYHGKLIIWDKVLGNGKTDPLSPYLENIALVIIAFYFLDATIKHARG